MTWGTGGGLPPARSWPTQLENPSRHPCRDGDILRFTGAVAVGIDGPSDRRREVCIVVLCKPCRNAEAGPIRKQGRMIISFDGP